MLKHPRLGVVVMTMACHTSSSGSSVADAGSTAPLPTSFSSSTDFACERLAPSVRVDWAFPHSSVGLGSIGGPPPPRPPSAEERAAFLRPMLATLSVDPPTALASVMQGILDRASDKVPAPAPAYLDCHGSTIAHRIARARVQFSVSADGKVDKVTIGLVDDADAGSPRLDFALRCLAAIPCAGVPYRNVPQGTVATYWFERATSGIDVTGPELVEVQEDQEQHAFRLGDTFGVRSAPVRVDDLTVVGQLPRETVRRVVRAHFKGLEACYDHAAAPNLNGKVMTKFVIQRDGTVSAVQDAGSDLHDAGVVSCVRGILKSLVFPTPEGGTVAVVASLVFEPRD